VFAEFAAFTMEDKIDYSMNLAGQIKVCLEAEIKSQIKNTAFSRNFLNFLTRKINLKS